MKLRPQYSVDFPVSAIGNRGRRRLRLLLRAESGVLVAGIEVVVTGGGDHLICAQLAADPLHQLPGKLQAGHVRLVAQVTAAQQ